MLNAMRAALVSLAVLAIMAGAGCTAKEIKSVEVPPPYSGYADSTLPALTGEALVAADEITNAKIYFEYDRFDIRPESRQVLARKADILKRHSQIRVSIQGHCDERGTEEYNMALGERRARAAYEFLTFSGVNPAQLEMISKGKLDPIVQGGNEAAWAQNRRDEFIVLNPRGR